MKLIALSANLHSIQKTYIATELEKDIDNVVSVQEVVFPTGASYYVITTVEPINLPEPEDKNVYSIVNDTPNEFAYYVDNENTFFGDCGESFFGYITNDCASLNLYSKLSEYEKYCKTMDEILKYASNLADTFSCKKRVLVQTIQPNFSLDTLYVFYVKIKSHSKVYDINAEVGPGIAFNAKYVNFYKTKKIALLNAKIELPENQFLLVPEIHSKFCISNEYLDEGYNILLNTDNQVEGKYLHFKANYALGLINTKLGNLAAIMKILQKDTNFITGLIKKETANYYYIKDNKNPYKQYFAGFVKNEYSATKYLTKGHPGNTRIIKNREKRTRELIFKNSPNTPLAGLATYAIASEVNVAEEFKDKNYLVYVGNYGLNLNDTENLKLYGLDIEEQLSGDVIKTGEYLFFNLFLNIESDVVSSGLAYVVNKYLDGRGMWHQNTAIQKSNMSTVFSIIPSYKTPITKFVGGIGSFKKNYVNINNIIFNNEQEAQIYVDNYVDVIKYFTSYTHNSKKCRCVVGVYANIQGAFSYSCVS